MTIQQKSRAMVQIIRPELPIAAGVCVIVGQVLALGELPPISMVGLGFLLGFLLSSSAMIFNDYFDLEVDRINAPQRPLPSGQLSQGEVIALGSLTGGLGLAVAFIIGPIVFVLGLITWLLGFLYNWKLKAAGIWGNLIVSFSVAMTFILGGVSVGQADNPMLWLFGLIAFLFDLAEEIAGDAMDMIGDQKRSSKSIAILHGKKTALRISSLLLVMMVILTLLPVLSGQTGLYYFVIMMITDLLILLFTDKLLKSNTPQEGRKWMRALYLSATLGLIALIIGLLIR